MYWMLSLTVLIGLSTIWLWANPGPLARHKPSPPERKLPLNAAERELFRRLLAVYPDHLILPHQPLNQLLSLPAEHSSKALKQWSQLQCDLVICSGRGEVVSVIELLPLSHPEHSQACRRYLEAAGLRVVQWSLDEQPSDALLLKLLAAPAVEEKVEAPLKPDLPKVAKPALWWPALPKRVPAA